MLTYKFSKALLLFKKALDLLRRQTLIRKFGSRSTSQLLDNAPCYFVARFVRAQDLVKDEPRQAQ